MIEEDSDEDVNQEEEDIETSSGRLTWQESDEESIQDQKNRKKS